MRSYLITLVFDLLGGVWAVDWVGSGSQACLTPLQLFKEARTISIQGGGRDCIVQSHPSPPPSYSGGAESITSVPL